MRPADLTDGMKIMMMFQGVNQKLWSRALNITQAAEFTGYMYELTEDYEDNSKKYNREFKIVKVMVCNFCKIWPRVLLFFP